MPEDEVPAEVVDAAVLMARLQRMGFEVPAGARVMSNPEPESGEWAWGLERGEDATDISSRLTVGQAIDAPRLAAELAQCGSCGHDVWDVVLWHPSRRPSLTVMVEGGQQLGPLDAEEQW